jgi:hypothetical protein
MHDLTGQRFGLLVVIGRSERKIPHGSLWRCHCDCGREREVRSAGMCDRWRDSYSAFLADVGRRPSDAHSIDRIDNDGHYEPGNVRWVTGSEQQQNRRPYSEWMQRHRAADGTFVAH